MTENDAIAKFKRTSVFWESDTNTEMVEAVKVAIQAIEEIQQYRAIGTIEEFKALKEKNTPKKRGIWKSGHTCCPNCERGVLTADRFCSYCGQALKPKET